MMELVKTLLQEHDEIWAFTERMQQMCVDFMENNQFDEQAFRQAIQFIREFADKEHHQKEERLLFRAMTDELGSLAVNLIQHGMLVEHDQARLYVSDLEQAVTAYAQTKEAVHKLNILANATSYCAHIRRHIEKENDAVYPFAERSLKPETIAALEQEFALEQQNKNN